MTTRELAQRMLKHTHVPEEVDEEMYIRHLAMFVSLAINLYSTDFDLYIYTYLYYGANLSETVRVMQK